MIIIKRSKAACSFIGLGTASSNFTVGVHANSLANDLTVATAMRSTGDTYACPAGTIGQQVTNHASGSAAICAKVISGSSDTFVFTGTGAPLRPRTFTFRGARSVTDKNSNAVSGTQVVFPSLNVASGGAVVLAVLIEEDNDAGAVISVDYSALTTLGFTEGDAFNTNNSTYYWYLAGATKFAGATITWTGTEEAMWCAMAVR